MRGDLHVHSTASDGTFTPTRLVAGAVSAGLDVLAIADHDTVAGQSEGSRAAAATHLTLVPAVELSCAIGDSDVHILGYHIDVSDARLLDRLERLKEARFRRAGRLVGLLRGAGYEISIDDVLRHSAGGAVGRSHIARALVSSGHAVDVSDAFDRFIGRNKPFYLPKEAQTASEAVGLIHEAGGAAVVAHPGIGDVRLHLDELRRAGIDGVEAYHADHGLQDRQFFADYARAHDLLVTGGTDFHGTSAPNPPLGLIDLPEEAVEALVAWPERH